MFFQLHRLLTCFKWHKLKSIFTCEKASIELFKCQNVLLHFLSCPSICPACNAHAHAHAHAHASTHTQARTQENGAEETTREVFSKQAFLCTKYNIVFRAMPIHEMELISSLLFFVSLPGYYLSGYPLFFLAPSSFVFAVYCSPVFACECWQVLNRMRRAKYSLSFSAKKESVMGLDLGSIQDRQITIAFQLHVF